MSLNKGQEQFYQLLTSTRYDPFLATLSWNNDQDGPCSLFLLPYHFDRLTCAAKTHKWDDHTTSILSSYDYLKSTCLDVISKERCLQNGSSSTAFRVILLLLFFHFSTASVAFFGGHFSIDSNYTFTRRSNGRDCNPFGDDFHVRSDFAINR